MAEDEKRKLYGGSYDDAISDTYQQIQSRPSFSYDVNGDALYQQYKDRYTQNAKNAMKDTMGQAAALTGGYGNSYAQAVGQQRYDETMRGLTDMIPTLEARAYDRWQDQGAALQNRYSMLMNLGQAEQANRQNEYSRLYALIGSTGYMPTAEELAAAGMSEEAAKALQTNWANSDPVQAYNNGVITAEQYYAMTGQWPLGYVAPGTSGGTGRSYYYNQNPYASLDPTAFQEYLDNEQPNKFSGEDIAKEIDREKRTAEWDVVRQLREEGASEKEVQEFIQAEGLNGPGTGGGSGPTSWDEYQKEELRIKPGR